MKGNGIVLLLAVCIVSSVVCGQVIETPHFMVIAPDHYMPTGEFQIIIAGEYANVPLAGITGGIYGDIDAVSGEALPAAGNLGSVSHYPDYQGWDFSIGDLEDYNPDNQPADGNWIVFTYQAPQDWREVHFGVYDYSISFDEPVAEVSLSPVAESCWMSLSQWNLDFEVPYRGAEADSQILILHNPCDRTRNWSFEHACPWLIVEPVSGTLEPEEEIELTVRVRTEGLNPGEYRYSFRPEICYNPYDPYNEGCNPFEVHLDYVTCYKGPDQSPWDSVGRPESWCNPSQCYGDADGQMEKIGKGYFRVGFNDISILLEGFGYFSNPYAKPWLAADFDHGSEMVGKGRIHVGFKDINILLEWFAKPNVPTDCNQ
ncbi:MAG: hypothetical protein JW828_13460 [Sedimentisphaerales bacterium]|nr:hypothetical protein [Sedimentisphaerales bacterium]